jgi:hypothetical protein
LTLKDKEYDRLDAQCTSKLQNYMVYSNQMVVDLLLIQQNLQPYGPMADILIIDDGRGRPITKEEKYKEYRKQVADSIGFGSGDIYDKSSFKSCREFDNFSTYRSIFEILYSICGMILGLFLGIRLSEPFEGKKK